MDLRDIEKKVGEVIWVSDPTPHEGKDIGDGTDLLIVEIKDPQ